MLQIRNLHVSVNGTQILKGIDLSVEAGEVHAIMGPNGSGKSTLANAVAGRPGYDISDGDILYEGESILGWTPDRRARAGVFLAMQYPVELPGVRNRQFLKAALDALREERSEPELSAREFDTLYRKRVAEIGMSEDLSRRNVNEGFSGGEKKRNEILQMAVLGPRLALLDETDSGLDIDALRMVADGVNRFRGPENTILLVTHYQRILNYVTPDFVHVLVGGRIVRSGGKGLALELEEKGYDWIVQEAAVAGI